MVRSHLHQEHCVITSPSDSINNDLKFFQVYEKLLLPYSERVASQLWLDHKQSEFLQIQVLETTQRFRFMNLT